MKHFWRGVCITMIMRLNFFSETQHNTVVVVTGQPYCRISLKLLLAVVAFQVDLGLVDIKVNANIMFMSELLNIILRIILMQRNTILIN